MNGLTSKTSADPLKTDQSKDRINVPDPVKALEEVRAKNGEGLYASAGVNYGEGIFGRDSLEAGEDILLIRPEIVREVIVTLAKFQGTKTFNLSQEMPGAIHHELRRLRADVSNEAIELVKMLQGRWGKDRGEDKVLYYGSIDATELFVNLVAKYAGTVDREILNQPILNLDGEPITIKESVFNAVNLIESRIKHSPIGLLEYQRTTPEGLAHQNWTDSPTSYIHRDGKLTNTNQLIAATEIQGLAYDSLKNGARIFADEYPDKAVEWDNLAANLQRITLAKLRMGEYFAMGIDRDENGQPRLIESLSSNPAILLTTSIFDNLPEAEKQRYISGIIGTIYNPQFLTDVGIRCRALRDKDLVPMQDQHGTWAVWIKQTFDIAKGFRKWGFNRLAEQLENRIINDTIISGGFNEFKFVDPDGHVYYGPQQKGDQSKDHMVIAGVMVPDNNQTWSITAALAIQSDNAKTNTDEIDETSWQYQLETQLLEQNPKIKIIETEADLEQQYPKFSYEINTILGWQKLSQIVSEKERIL